MRKVVQVLSRICYRGVQGMPAVLFVLHGGVLLLTGHASGLLSLAFAGLLVWVVITMERYFTAQETYVARARAVAMTHATITAYKVEWEGKQWQLRSLFSGWALPLVEGDIFYVANPEAVPSDIDASSFEQAQEDDI
jgi:hypothetical protein